MAFQPLPDGAKFVVVFGSSSATWTNTVWGTRPGFTEAELQLQTDNMHDQFEDLADIYLTSNWNVQTVFGYDMRAENAPVKQSIRPPYPGPIVDTPAPLNIAVIATFYTGQRGRSGRGRNYITGFGESVIGAQQLSDVPTLNALNAYWFTFGQSFTLNGWEWVVASGQQNGVPLAQRVAYPVTSAVVRNATLGTQRRRVPRS